MGHFERAAALFERAAELSPSDPISLCILADVYNALGRSKQSESTARRAMVRIETSLSERPDAAFTVSFGAATLVFLGQNQRAEEFADRAIVLDRESYIVRYNAGCTYAVIGKADAALECLEHIFSHMPRVRRWLLGMIGHDTQFDSLRGRADFKELVQRLEMSVATQ
jgi:adenylate cyclase